MKVVDKEIFDLDFHETAKVGKFITVTRVHRGFVYEYRRPTDTDTKNNYVSSAVFVPCERALPRKRLVYDDCRYYNDGYNSDWEYNWVPEEIGARCEHFHEFFRVIDSKVVPNCNDCPFYDKIRRRHNSK